MKGTCWRLDEWLKSVIKSLCKSQCCPAQWIAPELWFSDLSMLFTSFQKLHEALSVLIFSEWVACVRSNFLVLCYLHDVKNTLQLHDLATGALLKTFPLEVGSIVGYSGQKKDTEIFYQFTSFLSPGESLFPSVVRFKNQTDVWVSFRKWNYNAVLLKITEMMYYLYNMLYYRQNCLMGIKQENR